jgi:hypothetical protein
MPRRKLKEEDLYKPLIPPIPAFLKAISVLTILSKKRTSSMRPIDIGKGMIIEIANPIPKYTNSHIR